MSSHLDERFQQLRKKLPAHLNDGDVSTLRAVFYAGASSALVALAVPLRNHLTADDESADSFADMYVQLLEETSAFTSMSGRMQKL